MTSNSEHASSSGGTSPSIAAGELGTPPDIEKGARTLTPETTRESTLLAGSPAPSPHNFWNHMRQRVLSWFSNLYPWPWERSRSDQDIYDRLIYDKLEDYPKGWPQLAAFLNSDDSFGIFRRFGQSHCRVLVQLQAEITILEEELRDLDKFDSREGSSTLWRLKRLDCQNGEEKIQKEKIDRLRVKLLEYDELLIKFSQLKAMCLPSRSSHLDAYHWILWNKPVDGGQYNWILHAEDFVSVTDPQKFDYFLQSCLSYCSSFIKRLFKSKQQQRKTVHPAVDYYSHGRLFALATFLSVSVAVTVLLVPVFVLLWAPYNRALTASIVIVFVLAFAALMSLLTRTKVQIVFIGTATYCAVLVTLLGNLRSAIG